MSFCILNFSLTIKNLSISDIHRFIIIIFIVVAHKQLNTFQLLPVRCFPHPLQTVNFINRLKFI